MKASDGKLAALGAFLLALVYMNHYGVDHLAEGMADPQAARSALFYVAQGAKGVIFAAVIGLLAPRVIAALPLLAVCAWSAWEDALVVSCRLAKGIEVIPNVQLWSGLCGDGLYSAGLLVGLLAATVVGYGATRVR